MRKLTLILATVTGISCGNPQDLDSPDAGDADEVAIDAAACTEESRGELFERRIAPLLAQDRPASCERCHLPGVDLSGFVGDDSCSSMACLQKQGLVDLESPADSRLLFFIDRARAEPESDEIPDDVVAEEYAAVLAWIEHSARCHDELCAGAEAGESCGPVDVEPPPLEEPPALTRENYGCSRDGFVRGVHEHFMPTAEGRCGHCHAREFDTANPPPMWMDPDDSIAGTERTVNNALERDFIDFDKPLQSKWRLKPLSTELGGIEHGGSAKITRRDDELYIALTELMQLIDACQP